MSNTHVFRLPTGVECEVKELTGKHQRILTEQKNKKMGENLNELLADVIVRVGSKKNIDLNFVKTLLACDRKKILCEVRQFTMDFDPVFKFTYDYVSVADNAKKQHELEIDLSENFPAKPLMVEGEDGKLKIADYEEYDEIERKVVFKLPKSGKEITWSLLDGAGEAIGMNTAKADRSSHTAIKMRNPVEMVKTENDTVPVQLNLDNLGLKDIEALRGNIKSIEGNVDTEIFFTHPEAELKPKNEKDVIVDVLSVLAFFFPSEAI